MYLVVTGGRDHELPSDGMPGQVHYYIQVSDVDSSSCVVCRVVEDAAAKHAALLTNFCDCAHNKLSKYALGFFLCELLTIVITICHVGRVPVQTDARTLSLQILVTHVFLNYQYLDYGPHVYHYYRSAQRSNN